MSPTTNTPQDTNVSLLRQLVLRNSFGNPEGRRAFPSPRGEGTGACLNQKRSLKTTLARMQQLGQCGDVRDVAEVVDDLQARFHLPLTQLRPRYQRAVFSIDVSPVDAADTGSFRRVDGV